MKYIPIILATPSAANTGAPMANKIAKAPSNQRKIVVESIDFPLYLIFQRKMDRRHEQQDATYRNQGIGNPHGKT